MTTIFKGYIIHSKRKKTFTCKEIALALRCKTIFSGKRPSKQELKDAFFDDKIEKVSRIEIELVMK